MINNNLSTQKNVFQKLSAIKSMFVSLAAQYPKNYKINKVISEINNLQILIRDNFGTKTVNDCLKFYIDTIKTLSVKNKKLYLMNRRMKKQQEKHKNRIALLKLSVQHLKEPMRSWDY